ncbi:MAG: S41 family peptidase [Chthoniobacterales bacterium]
MTFFSGFFLKIIRPTLLLCILITGLSTIQGQDDENLEPTEDPAYANIRLFANILQLIQQEYYDEKKTSYEDLIESALRGMLDELDPHSQFLDEEGFQVMREETLSEFGGLGIQITIRNGTLVIVSPMEGSPSFKAGLLPNDEILKIDGIATDSLTQAEAIDALRGKIGEQITLTIRHPETKEIEDYTITRDIVKVPSVRGVKLIDSTATGGFKIGYIRITQFSEPTAKDFSKALDKLEKEGAQALVLDLRFNPGGLLTSAVDICGEFLPPGTQVVWTSGRRPSHPVSTPGNSKNRKIPLAILINSSSASGSEIVSGALKDLQRALLIGETSFGKGSVQSVISVDENSEKAIRLTTATYLTPGKQPIHGVGISPHIKAPMTPHEEIRILSARRAESLPENIRKDFSKIPPTDIPLDRAIDALRGILLNQERKKTTSVHSN